MKLTNLLPVFLLVAVLMIVTSISHAQTTAPPPPTSSTTTTTTGSAVPVDGGFGVLFLLLTAYAIKSLKNEEAG